MPFQFDLQQNPDEEPALSLPYNSDLENGRTNHGFTDLRGQPDRARRIPEATCSPALTELLVALAQPGSKYFSIGCIYKQMPRENDHDRHDQTGGYIQLAYADLEYEAADHWCQVAFATALELRFEEALSTDTWKVVVTIGAIGTEGIGGPGIVWSMNIDYWAWGDTQDEANRSADRLLDVVRKTCAVWPARLGAPLVAAAGEAQRAKDWVTRFVAANPTDAELLFNAACAYALMGELEWAIPVLQTWLRAARPDQKHWIELEADLAPVRSHPRYPELLASAR